MTKRYLVTLFSVCGRKAAVVASRAIAKICLVLLIAQLGCAVQAVVLQPPPDAPVQTVEMTAKKYSFCSRGNPRQERDSGPTRV